MTDSTPRWRSAGQAGGLPDDPVLCGWLENSGSLTRRLRDSGGSGFMLEVLDESWEQASDEERRQLGTRDTRLRVRRVRLGCDGVQLVYACTLMPCETLEKQPWLARLGDRPLGEALEDVPEVTRSDFEYAWIDADHDLLADALRGTDIAPSGLWARRSRFTVDGSSILVYEVFLPGLSSAGEF